MDLSKIAGKTVMRMTPDMSDFAGCVLQHNPEEPLLFDWRRHNRGSLVRRPGGSDERKKSTPIRCHFEN
jgi:hypothetical protein